MSVSGTKHMPTRKSSGRWVIAADRKSTRLNSSHLVISYAVFCLKNKTLMYRDDPILVGAIPAVPPNDNTFYFSAYRSGAVWNQLEASGIPEVRGVWAHEAGGGRF